MRKSMKKIFNILIILAVLIVFMTIARDLIIKKSLENIVSLTTGLKLEIGQLKVSVPKTFISIRDMNILNPEGFSDKTMLIVPEVYVDYDLLELLKKEVRLREVRVNLKEFVVVKNAKGQTNLEYVKGLGREKDKKKDDKKGSSAPDINIDKLSLKIGKVIYKDYSSGGKPAVSEYNINIDARYKNIKNPGEIIKIIVAKALMNTALGKITDFNQFKDMPMDVLEEGKVALKKTIDGLRNVIKSPF